MVLPVLFCESYRGRSSCRLRLRLVLGEVLTSALRSEEAANIRHYFSSLNVFADVCEVRRNSSWSEERRVINRRVKGERVDALFRATAVPGFVDLIFRFRLGQTHVVTRFLQDMGTQAQEKILRTFRTSSMNKRLPQGDHQMDNSKKRKRSNGVSDSGLVPENIISARHLQGLLGDFSTQEALNNG